MKMKRSIGLALVATLLMVTFGACAKYKDALVSNPCGHNLVISFWNDDEPPPGSDAWRDRTEIPALTAERVDNVFTDGGEVAVDGYVRIESEHGPTLVRKVPYSADSPVPVTVPASVCSAPEAQ